MTCEEFRAFLNSTKPSDVTRAERAAVIRHAIVCVGCMSFVDKISGVLTPESKAMMVRDMEDPEYMRTLRGE